jgi:hypothetical protein
MAVAMWRLTSEYTGLNAVKGCSLDGQGRAVASVCTKYAVYEMYHRHDHLHQLDHFSLPQRSSAAIVISR